MRTEVAETFSHTLSFSHSLFSLPFQRAIW